MPTRVELLEPGEAIPKSRGYVGVTDPSETSEIFFPHVDSCLALVLILDNNRLIGGHVPQQWPGQGVPNLNFCVKKIIDLMDAELKRVGGTIQRLIMVGDRAWFHADRGTEANTAMAQWEQYENWIQLSVEPQGGGGTDVSVTRKSIKLVKCKQPRTEQTYNNLSNIQQKPALTIRL